MRTSVQTDPSDPDETDEWPECMGSANPQDGQLDIVDKDNLIEATYERGEWVAFTSTA